jgi:histidine triad (HIT) family protein
MTDLTHLFERIAAGEVPSHKVYEDDLVFAFLDISPLSEGHTLVIPKQRYETIGDLPDEVAAALGRVLPRLARAVASATGAEAYNVLVNTGEAAGQVVPHVHFHIIPKHSDGSGLTKRWDAGELNDGEELAKKIAERID